MLNMFTLIGFSLSILNYMRTSYRSSHDYFRARSMTSRDNKLSISTKMSLRRNTIIMGNQRNPRGNQERMPIRGLSFHLNTKLIRETRYFHVVNISRTICTRPKSNFKSVYALRVTCKSRFLHVVSSSHDVPC